MTVNFKHLFQYVKPFLLSLAVAFFMSVLYTSFGFYHSFINIFLGVVFYFSVCYPAFFNTLFVFLLGLCCDYLMQAPLGMNAFLLTLMHFLAYFNRQNILSLPFQFQWLVFVLLNSVVFCVALVLLKMAYTLISGMDMLLLRYVLISACYPFVAYVCGHICKKMEYHQ